MRLLLFALGSAAVLLALPHAGEDSPPADDTYLDAPLPGHFLFRATPSSYRQIRAQVDGILADVQAATASGDCMEAMTPARPIYSAECRPEAFFRVVQVMRLCEVLEMAERPRAVAPGTVSLVPDVEPPGQGGWAGAMSKGLRRAGCPACADGAVRLHGGDGQGEDLGSEPVLP